MSPELVASIKRHEGLRLSAYQDTCGIWTCGYGHAHVAPGTVWTQDQAEQVLEQDIGTAEKECDAHIPWWRSLDPVRADVVCELMFNMGWPTLSTFKNTLAAVKAGDYERAAVGMLASRWASQVKGRATRLAAQMRTGVR